MCAIFGYVSDKPIELNLQQLLDIGELNVKRGNQSFGYLGIADKGFVIGRHDLQFSNKMNLSFLKSCNIVLFHLLSSTGTEKRIHPFETDQFIFAHNGLLLDYQEQHIFDYLGPVDSQYLLAAINSIKAITVAESIKYANEHFKGQRACWLWDKKAQALYLWRVMSPLYVEIGERQIIFSSVKVADSYINLPEGKVFGIKDMVLKHLANFNFYSPYGER